MDDLSQENIKLIAEGLAAGAMVLHRHGILNFQVSVTKDMLAGVFDIALTRVVETLATGKE